MPFLLSKYELKNYYMSFMSTRTLPQVSRLFLIFNIPTPKKHICHSFQPHSVPQEADFQATGFVALWVLRVHGGEFGESRKISFPQLLPLCLAGFSCLWLCTPATMGPARWSSSKLSFSCQAGITLFPPLASSVLAVVPAPQTVSPEVLPCSILFL